MRTAALTLAAVTLVVAVAVDAGPAAAAPEAAAYQQRRPSRDGIGKVYMGREIAHVMGYQGAGWLERPTRLQEERTDLLIENLPLAPDFTVADIGAGTGYFSLPIARRLPAGRVLAVDLQPQMLDIIRRRTEAEGVDNVEPVQASETDVGLEAESVDLALFVDVYHELSHPREVMASVRRALKPGGVVVLVEYRAEDPSVPIKPLHKMSERQARREMRAADLEWVETMNVLPQQHLMVFRKP